MKKGAEAWVEEGFKQFAEKGIEGIKIAPLSRNVGVAKSSFYHYFESANGFFEEILDYWISEFSVKAFEEGRKEKNPKNKFCSWAFINLKEKTPGSFLAQLISLSNSNEYVRSRMEYARELREKYVISLLTEEGIDEGLIRQERELLFALSFGWSYRNIEKSLSDVEKLQSLASIWDSMVLFLKGRAD